MNTKEYIDEIRKKTGYNDYKIAKTFDINQSNLSKYSRGMTTLSESHAFLFASILNISPAQIIAHTKLESAIKKNDGKKIEFWQDCVNRYTSKNNDLPKIALAQINPIVGDLSNNAQQIINGTQHAKDKGADIVVFPELSTIGYVPEDLMFRHNFISQVIDTNKFIIDNIPDDIWIIFGSITYDELTQKTYNTAFVIYNQAVYTYHKRELPNYGVFDEKRYFSSGNKPLILEMKQHKVGILICEDVWSENIVSENVKTGANALIVINASPFTQNKYQQRLKTFINYVHQYQISIIYLNCVGGQDELVFDGGSFIINTAGNIIHQADFFSESLTINDNKKISKVNVLNEKLTYDSLVMATRDYIHKNNFKTAVIGLSGGIDSALTLAITSDAIGADNVTVIMMPSKFTAQISLLDAQTQANTMGVIYHNIAIESLMQSFDTSLSALFAGQAKDTTEENIQARIRGTLLMAVSNKTNSILITTGNKSEYATGYATLYGDMNGGFAPLKDIYKTQVYALAKYRNSLGFVIPERVITRPPSAELSDNQTDQDSLPNYDVLDNILKKLLEQRLSSAEIIAQGFDDKIVNQVVCLIIQSEHKRRQSAPGVKISDNAFGRERRYPITSKFKF